MPDTQCRPMKALTIQQPHASLIASGQKWVENRTWKTSYRGPLAIHAGKGTKYLTKGSLADYPTSCVIAVAELITCVSVRWLASSNGLARIGSHTIAEWFAHSHTEGPYCWLLIKVRPIEPIQRKGFQGLWNFYDHPIREMEGKCP